MVGTGTRTVEVLVSGHVQGVGFRWHTWQEATRLGLVGEVGNLPDGRVAVLAQGPGDQVEALLAWLGQGPRWATVTGLEVQEVPGPLRCQSFTVSG